MSEPEPRIPDVAHWLEGWRTWRVAQDGLRSLGQEYVWPARQAAHAECAHRARLGGMLLDCDNRGDLASSAAWRMMQATPVAVIFAVPSAREALKRALAEHGPAPGQSCMCGLYARLAPPPWEDLPGHGHGFVVGRVALWGKVIRGATGMRAEYAYPLSLSDRRWARRYGVPYDRRLAYRTRARFYWWIRGVVTMNAAINWLLPLFWFDWQWNPALWWGSTVALTTLAYLEWRDYR